MTLENIAWIVGVHTGNMIESEREWAKKIKGQGRTQRVYECRQLVYLVLAEECGMSYREIAAQFSRRHLSVVSRSLSTVRAWVKESTANAELWDRIRKDVRAAIEAEQEAQRKAYQTKLGTL